MENKTKQIIVAAVIGLLFVVFGLYQLGYLSSFTNSSNSNTTFNNPNGAGPNYPNTTGGSNPTSSPVTFQPATTVNAVDNSSSVGISSPPPATGGKVRSVSMVGPSGVYNSLVQTDGRNFTLIRKGFTELLINEGAVSTEDIKKALNQYIADSWNSNPRPSSNGDIQIVIASSVANNPKVVAALPELKRTYVVTTTSSDLEGAGGFKVAVAPQYQSTAMVMDLTPTITRLTYSPSTGVYKTIVAKTGTKYFQNGQSDEQALNEMRTALAQIPTSNRQQCIVLWAAAEKDLRQGSNRYSGIPSYSGNKSHIVAGLKLINEAKSPTTVIDFEAMWFSSY